MKNGIRAQDFPAISADLRQKQQLALRRREIRECELDEQAGGQIVEIHAQRGPRPADAAPPGDQLKIGTVHSDFPELADSIRRIRPCGLESTLPIFRQVAAVTFSATDS